MAVIDFFQHLCNGICTNFTYYLILNKVKKYPTAVWYNILITMVFGMLFPSTSCFPMRNFDMQVRTRRSGRNPQTVTEQWESPCGRGQHISMPLRLGAVTQSHILQKHYEDIWSRAHQTKQETEALKRLFVEERGEQNREAIGLPDFSVSGTEFESVQPHESATVAFRDLAKLGILLEKTREDEMRVQPGSSFVQKYERLEQQGIYWLLCELHKLIRNLNTEISSEIIEEIEGHKVFNARDTVTRHRRDFIILELLDDQLHNVRVKFQRLAEGGHTS